MVSETRSTRTHAVVATSVEDARLNRNKMRDMVESAAMTDAQVVSLLMAESDRPCGVRTLHWWLHGDEQKKPQRCPDWAVEAFEKALARRRSGSDQ
jgi:hypothetical protein